MASFNSTQYSVVLHYIGASKEQSHLVTVTGGGAGEAAQMYFSSTGDGAVQVDSPTLAKGFFPLDQYEGFLKTIELLMANGGAQVIIDENSPVGIRISSQGTMP